MVLFICIYLLDYLKFWKKKKNLDVGSHKIFFSQIKGLQKENVEKEILSSKSSPDSLWVAIKCHPNLQIPCRFPSFMIHK